MVRQQTLFAGTLDLDFAKFHEANPEIYVLFEQFARQAKAAGFKHYGAKSIVERIRWHCQVETHNGGFKINNNLTSRYARLLAADHPEFKDFFRNRLLRS